MKTREQAADEVAFEVRGISVRELPKYRMRTWYWGKYVTHPLHGTKWDDYERYDENRHGWHNSEEYKNGKNNKG